MKKDFCKTANLLGQQIFKKKLLEFSLLWNTVLIVSLLYSNIFDMMKADVYEINWNKTTPNHKGKDAAEK